MKWFKNLFCKNQKAPSEIPPMPSWNKIVEMMYDKCLDAFADEVIQVIYSQDRTMRYVVLKSEKGLFTFQLEEIQQFDDDEWKYIFSEKDAMPAMWEPPCGYLNNSIFETKQDAIKELMSEPAYKQYFTGIIENFHDEQK